MLEIALQVLKEITEYGYEAYLVGGYPRDYYLGEKSADIDICTSATPREMKEIFPGVVMKNEQYGNVSFVYRKIPFEVTTFRKELQYKDHRIPEKVVYIKDLREDLVRRDFVMNTLCMDQDGVYIDYLGAIQDIDQKLIRMVGDPKIRLKEDVLRILRGVRLATTLNFKIDDTLKYYMKEYGYLLKDLSYERKKDELDKIFASPNVMYGVSLLLELSLDVYLDLEGLSDMKVTTSLLGMWAQVKGDCKYPFSKQEKREMEKIVMLSSFDILEPMVMYRYGLYYLGIVGDMRGISRKDITMAYSLLPIHSRKDIMISVNDICQILDRKPGRFLKEIYENLEEEIVMGRLRNEKEDIVSFILKYGSIQKSSFDI